MKKVLSFRNIIMIGIVLMLLGTNIPVFATGVLGGNNSVSNISAEEYQNAGTIPTDPNYLNTSNNSATNNTSNGINTSSAYNKTNENTTDLPQTGIEDYNIGILLIICVGASIYTYKKMRDYKNI